jgi:hypothetical protein
MLQRVIHPDLSLSPAFRFFSSGTGTLSLHLPMICLLGFDGQVASVCSFVFMLFPCSSQGKAQQSVVFCYLILELYIALDIFFDNILLLILRNVQLQ